MRWRVIPGDKLLLDFVWPRRSDSRYQLVGTVVTSNTERIELMLDTPGVLLLLETSTGRQVFESKKLGGWCISAFVHKAPREFDD